VEKGNLTGAAAAISTAPESASHPTTAEPVTPSEDEASDPSEGKGSAKFIAPGVCGGSGPDEGTGKGIAWPVAPGVGERSGTNEATGIA